MKHILFILCLVLLSFNTQGQYISGNIYFDNRGNVGVSGHGYYYSGHRYRRHYYYHQHRPYPRYNYRAYTRPLYCNSSWIRSGQTYFRSCHVSSYYDLPRYHQICYDGYLVTIEVTQYRYDGYLTIRESYTTDIHCR